MSSLTQIDEARVSHYPLLSRFYGLSFEEVANMPHWAVNLYLRSIAEIEANEQLILLQAMDFPHIDVDSRKRVHRSLLRAVGAEENKQAVDATDESTKRSLSGIGIAVVATPVRKEEEVTDA